MKEAKYIYFIRHITHKFIHSFVRKGLVKPVSSKTFILESGQRIPRFPSKNTGYVVFDSPEAALEYFKEQADERIKRSEANLAREIAYKERLLRDGIEVKEC